MKHHSWKQILGRVLTDPSHKQYFLVHDFLALLTIVSIVAVVLETVPSLDQYSIGFLIAEWVAVVFFGAEYIARIIITKPVHKYTFSFFGIIDLVSILPTLLGIGNLTFLKSARALRIIRLLRLMRLAKLGRNGVNDEEGLGIVSLNILIYAATLLLSLLVIGTAMYLVEHDHENFSSIPAAMWWSLKVFLGSIAVPQPVSTIGEVFYVVARFVGMLLLGLLVGVVGNIFRSVMFSGKK
jgi:voltage-gated potassium channel